MQNTANETISKKASTSKPNYKSRDWKYFYAKFMMFWAVIGQVWLLVQTMELYHKQDSTGLSLTGFLLLLLGGIFWGVYGFYVLNRNHVIVISSMISVVLSIILIAGILLYK